MNYYIFAYPILSLACFVTVFFYPQAALFLFFLSPIILLAYLENPLRTAKTDFLSALISLCFAFIDILIIVYFVFVILIPMLILESSRRKLPEKAYIPVAAAPLPIVIIMASGLILFPDFKDSVQASCLEFINTVTAHLEGSAQQFENMGVFSFIFANKEKGAFYVTCLMPSLIFSIISTFTFVIDRIRPKFIGDKLISRDYALPDKFVWWFIAGGFPILFDDINIKLISINILIIFALLYFFRGIQMMSVLFDRFHIGNIIRGLIYILIFSEPPIMAFLSLMGLFNIWFKPKWAERSEAGE